MTDKDMHLEIRSDPRLLGSVRSVIRTWLVAYELDEETADGVVLAIDEACSNAMRHAYEGRCDEVIELTLHATPDVLEFVLFDRGVPCPKECLEKRSVRPSSVDELSPGGLGVPLMFEVFDEVDFSPGVEQGNRVVLRLKRSR
ncbi:MAG: ATP-binding protein [bacterium]|nr:ATP-binding protein [bacterium]